MRYVEELERIKSEGLLRTLRVNRPSGRGRITIEGKEYVNFCSNDYLGLSTDERVVSASRSAAKIYGVGAASSRLLSGTFDIHEELESLLAKFKKSESAIVFPTGYQANLGVISALAGRDDCVIIDRLVHASIIDGCRLSGAKIFVWRHRDCNDLEKILKKTQGYSQKLIITDAIFSMDGDVASLKEISDLARNYAAMLMVDEAHSTGVFGKTGAGVAEYTGVEDRIDVKMGTLSKAIGSQGGFVCVRNEIKNYLVNKARGFIYTTGLSPLCAVAAIEAIKIIRESEEKRKELLTLANNLRKKLKKLGLNTLDSQSQIIPILIGDTEKTVKVSSELFENGLYAPAIRYPTVPKNLSRIRISLNTNHTEYDLQNLCNVLKNSPFLK